MSENEFREGDPAVAGFSGGIPDQDPRKLGETGFDERLSGFLNSDTYIDYLRHQDMALMESRS